MKHRMISRMRGMGLGVAMLAAFGLAMLPQAHAQTEVDLELVLAVDVSGSVNSTRFDLQRDGWADAFRTPEVQQAIDEGDRGQIAASLVYWSTDQVTAVSWTLIGDGSGGSMTASDFGDLIAAAPRPTSAQVGGVLTGVAGAMTYSTDEINGNDFAGDRRVIDVSGDGTENVDGDAEVQAARDSAEGQDITVNGLAIEEDTFISLTDWYEANVMTSDGFVLTAEEFGDIEEGAIQKLQFEVSGDSNGVPAPPALLLFMTGLLLLGGRGLLARSRLTARG